MTYYHSPRSIEQAFRSFFTIEEMGGLNIFTPPPGSASAYRFLSPVLPLLERWEDAIHQAPLARRVGDHIYYVMRRNHIGTEPR
jgi:hypothetical protein